MFKLVGHHTLIAMATTGRGTGFKCTECGNEWSENANSVAGCPRCGGFDITIQT
jgi:Zn finger protein HypA/HybF involved in hydrogenase expression